MNKEWNVKIQGRDVTIYYVDDKNADQVKEKITDILTYGLKERIENLYRKRKSEKLYIC